MRGAGRSIRTKGQTGSGPVRAPRLGLPPLGLVVVLVALLAAPLTGPRAALAQDAVTDEAPIVPLDPSTGLPADTASVDDPNAPADVVLDDPAATDQTDPPPVPVSQPPVLSAPVVDPNWAPPRTVYVPETGHTIDGLFLDLWRGGGGANAFGYPITREITEEDGHVVQYYQYARFEYWPEGDAEGNAVTLGTLGRELRPLAIPRPLPPAPANPNAQTYQAGAGGHAREAMRAARAWLPVAAEEVPAGVEDWRYVAETRHGVWGLFRSFWEATGEEAYLGYPLTEEYVLGGTSYQVFERGQLAWEEGADPYLVPLGELTAARYKLPTEPVGQGDVPTYSEDLFVPRMLPAQPVADAAGAPPPPPGYAKSIVVSLGRQTLWAYDHDTVVRSTLVSTGKERFETPPGMFFVNSKLPVQDMAGVIGGESYNVPQVPDVMYFTDRGHALHGTYWHSNFGAVMSHGCINVPMDVSKWLYDWTPTGTPVLIVP